VNKIEENKKPFDSEAICGVFINEKGQILLAQRQAGRSFGKNEFDLMGGDILPDETPIETLLRDAKEKFGFQLNKEIIEVKNSKDVAYQNKTIRIYIFVYKLNSDTPVQLDAHKFQWYKWCCPEEIDQFTLTPKVKPVLTAIGLLK
jgi:8-oxo-dGTP pyrophosphatase MutT (NUDIX family)